MLRLPLALLLPLSLLLVAFTGCTSTQTLTPDSAGSARANQAFAGKTVQLTRIDGTTVDALSVVVYGDSTSWIDPGTQTLVQVPTAEVVRLSQHSRGRGAVQGALLSGLITTITVSTLVMAEFDDWGSYNGVKPALGLAVGAAAFVPGTVPGAIVGYLGGAERRYDVSPSLAPPAPDGSPTARNQLGRGAQYSPTGSTSRLMR